MFLERAGGSFAQSTCYFCLCISRLGLLSLAWTVSLVVVVERGRCDDVCWVGATMCARDR